MFPEASICRVDPEIYLKPCSESHPNNNQEVSEEEQYANAVIKFINDTQKLKDPDAYKPQKQIQIPDEVSCFVFFKKTSSNDQYLSVFGVQDCKTDNFGTIAIIPLLKEDNKVKAMYAMSGGFSWRALHVVSESETTCKARLKLRQEFRGGYSTEDS